MFSKVEDAFDLFFMEKSEESKIYQLGHFKVELCVFRVNYESSCNA